MRLRESTGASLSGHAARLPMRDTMALAHRLRASGAALAAPLHDLLAGHARAFAEQVPIYGASVWPRLPFAWLADAAGAGDLGVYRAGVFACLLPLAALIFWLVRRMQEFGRPAHEQAALAAVLLAAPVALRPL